MTLLETKAMTGKIHIKRVMKTLEHKVTTQFKSYYRAYGFESKRSGWLVVLKIKDNYVRLHT